MQSTQPKLITLKDGLTGIVAPMLCGDVVGPQSMFGEYARIPRPLRPVSEKDFSLEDADFANQLYAKSAVLWEGGESNCSVAATTFMTGQCESAFDVAWALCAQGMMQPFSSVICTSQTKGRGQMRKHWQSPHGNLYVAFMLPKDPAFSGPAASVVVGMLAVQALRDSGYEVFLKWPNDLISAKGCKVGGILLEEKNGILIAGLGINLFEAPAKNDLLEAEALPATILSLAATIEEDEVPAPFVLWRTLVERMIVAYTTIVKGQEYVTVMQKAESLMAWKNCSVTVFDGNTPEKTATCKGLGTDGGLLLGYADGRVEEIFSGSVRPR